MTVKTISLNDAGFIIDELRGKDILIKVNSNGMEFKTSSTIDSVAVFTNKIMIKLNNHSKIDLLENAVHNVVLDSRLSKDGTNSIEISMTNQFISIEYDVKEENK